jgi:sepiapterin reductase
VRRGGGRGPQQPGSEASGEGGHSNGCQLPRLRIMSSFQTLSMHDFIIVTGASRGFGRALAVAFATAATERKRLLSMVLWATDAAALCTTAELVKARCPGARTLTQTVDLADIASLPGHWRSAAAFAPPHEVSARAILVQNAGTLGALQRIAEWTDFESLSTAIAVNVTAPTILSSLFLRWVHSDAAPPASPADCSLVNVSSLAAVVPFRCWATYCTGKAARDMLGRCIAEEEGVGGVRVLSYAPGPLDTDMQVRAGPDRGWGRGREGV